VLRHLGTQIYVVGSDYVYPRTLGATIRKLVQRAGGVISGDRYVPLGTTNFGSVIDEISVCRPEVVISNIVGTDSVPAFYRQFRSAGYTADTLPIAATVTSEVEVRAMTAGHAVGHYMTATYFGSLANPSNGRYVSAFTARFGKDAVTHVPQIGAYNAVWLLAMAARRSVDLSFDSLRSALVGITFDENPEGWPIRVFPNHHTDHPSYIGRTRSDGQFDIVAEFGPRDPDPYPPVIVPERNRPRAGTVGELG